MDLSLEILVSPAKMIALTTAAAIAVICLAPSFTITTNAQQLQTSQPSITQSPTLLNSKDSFRVQLPEGWVIQDINNTGFTLAAEVLQGYGLLAELCPQQEQSIISSNVSSTSTSSNRYIGTCQHAREEVIHIIRYPNLGARLGVSSDEDVFTIINNRDILPNAVLAYHLQKLQEVGYRDFKIVNSMDTTINVDNSTTDLSNNGMATRTTTTTIPAKLVEMTYSTSLAPDEIRSGYFILTATAATPRNLGMITGYSIFYEGNSTATAEEATTISTGSTVASPSSTSSTSLPPPPVRHIFDSFELIAARTEPLTVEITSEETEGIAPATFEFEAEVTGGMEPYVISWDFGDDGSSGGGEEENDEDIEHTFDIAGTYNVRVSVTDSTGRTASDSILIIVDAPPPPPPLTAVDIISNGTEGIAPATFEFEAEVTGGTGPYTYRWNFGDGSSSRESNTQTVLHTFDQAGRYNVGLIVMDSQDQIAFDSIAITVEEEEPPTIEEQPNLDDVDDNSGSDAFFDLDDSLERLERQNNGITVGGTSAADDYDATADD